jgi:hypothetical protein
VTGIALKGKRAPFYSRMIHGMSGDRLDWMMENGLAWRGYMPLGWNPEPKTLSAWLYYLFVMLPRGLVR